MRATRGRPRWYGGVRGEGGVRGIELPFVDPVDDQ